MYVRNQIEYIIHKIFTAKWAEFEHTCIRW